MGPQSPTLERSPALSFVQELRAAREAEVLEGRGTIVEAAGGIASPRVDGFSSFAGMNRGAECFCGID